MPENESVAWTSGVAFLHEWSSAKLWVITPAFKRMIYGKWDALTKNTIRLGSWHVQSKQTAQLRLTKPHLTLEGWETRGQGGWVSGLVTKTKYNVEWGGVKSRRPTHNSKAVIRTCTGDRSKGNLSPTFNSLPNFKHQPKSFLIS